MASVDASDADYLHDVFLAHATADKPVCLKLYEALEKAGVHVFIDVKGLDGAAEWVLEFPLHQKQSRLTLVFVSELTPAAWFHRAEIARAITQRRFGDRAHAVLPIWGAGPYRPYGLEMLTGLAWQDDAAGVDAVVEGTLAVLIGLSALGKREEALLATQEAVAICRALAQELPQCSCRTS
jgi:hypothetical protein